MLREQLVEAEVLERYLKAENVKLRDRVAALREQKKAIKNRGTFYYRKRYRCYREAIKLTKRVNTVKREIHQLRGRTNASSQLHLLAKIANRA
jgi:cell division protein FtsB